MIPAVTPEEITEMAWGASLERPVFTLTVKTTAGRMLSVEHAAPGPWVIHEKSIREELLALAWAEIAKEAP